MKPQAPSQCHTFESRRSPAQPTAGQPKTGRQESASAAKRLRVFVGQRIADCSDGLETVRSPKGTNKVSREGVGSHGDSALTRQSRAGSVAKQGPGCLDSKLEGTGSILSTVRVLCSTGAYRGSTGAINSVDSIDGPVLSTEFNG